MGSAGGTGLLMEDDENMGGPERPESLLPYDEWSDEAMRGIMVRALAYAAAHGLPGDHHFYLTFRTDYPGVVIPSRLLAQFPQEMTIVLQHQYRNLTVDEADGHMSVGLSFGGIPATLVIPFAAIMAFADPAVQFGLRFTVQVPEPAPEPETPPAPPETTSPASSEASQVVSLDAFRRRTPKD
jgi:uncharacterized protein